jgi:hypothetical protein
VVTRLILIIMLLLASFASSALTRLTATIDKNPVMANESFILSIEADANLSTSALRTDVLMKDFVVGRTNTSAQTQIINSDIKHSTTWTVMLISRKPGNYTIPAFTIDNVSSSPVHLKVITASKQPVNNNKNVFLETSVDKSTVYLQSSIQFTTKLYLAVEIQRGSLTEPEMENANIRQIGKKDEEESEIRDGVRYRVIKRVYAITPQRSGKYEITAPVFNGELVMNKRRSFFSGFNNTKPVSLIGDKLKIEVLPIPGQYSGQWLPSELVVVNEEWQPNTQTYTVGDPITRIVTLTAIGVSQEQLPEIVVQYPPEVKTYPDQSTLNSTTRDNRLIAQRKDSVAIVPSRAGTLILPEVKIPWWNTRLNEMAYATLPAKTLQIEPSANAIITPQAAVQPIITAPVRAPATVSTEMKEVQVNGYLTWSFLAAWLLSMLLWMFHVRHLKNTGVKVKAKPVTTSAPERNCWANFEAACKGNDPVEANAQLLQWGRARWPDKSFTSAMDVALFLDCVAVVDALKALQQHLYSNFNGKWKGGEALVKTVGQNKSPKVTVAVDNLSPLHPV